MSSSGGEFSGFTVFVVAFLGTGPTAAPVVIVTKEAVAAIAPAPITDWTLRIKLRKTRVTLRIQKYVFDCKWMIPSTHTFCHARKNK
jgi:hypothetical protein